MERELVKRIFVVLIFLFILLVCNTIFNPALLSNFLQWWDQELYTIVFYIFYLTIICITILSVASISD